MRKTALIFLVFAGVLSISAVVISQSPMKKPRTQNFTRPQHGNLFRALETRKEELKITDEQLAQIKDILMKWEEKRVEHQNHANTQQLQIKKWHMDTDNRDYNALRALLNLSAQARTDMLISRMQLRDQINNILTEEQKEAIRANNRGRMGRGHKPPARFKHSSRSFQKRFDR